MMAFIAVPASAQPGTSSFLEYQARMHADADEYLFFEDDRKQVVSYNRERIVRVCAGESSQVTPMRIEYDDKTSTVAPGDCMRVEAMQVYLQPAEMLEPNSYLRVEVDTLN
jgi:hypothetical protein